MPHLSYINLAARSEAPDLYSLFRTVLAHDGGATGASFACGTRIKLRTRGPRYPSISVLVEFEDLRGKMV